MTDIGTVFAIMNRNPGERQDWTFLLNSFMPEHPKSPDYFGDISLTKAIYIKY